ncbi:MAG: helix-turn-helix domain-containing protein [Steroidobacteraceae bacterium]
MQSRSLSWKKAFDALEQAINAEGVHTYPFDPAFPVDVAFLVHTSGHNVRMNRHGYLEVIYVYEGDADIQILERHFPVQRGDLLIVGANLYHRVVTPPGHEVKLISLNFEPAGIGIGERGDEEEYLAPFVRLSERLSNAVCRSASVSVRALELLLQVHEELRAKSCLSHLAVSTYMRMLLLLLRKYYDGYLEHREAVDTRQRDLQRLAPLFDHLEKHPGQPIQVAKAARICAMSSSHFMSTFKKTTGESFIAYLNSFRVEKAQRLLSQTGQPIAEISAQLAFCSQSYFGKVFHALVGMTPRAYRAQFTNDAVADDQLKALPDEARSEPARRRGQVDVIGAL